MKGKVLLSSLLFTAVAGIMISGCDPAKKWEKQEQDTIDSYLNSLGGDTVYTKKTSGLYYLDLVIGTGAQPAVNDTVSIKYKGSFLTGTEFATNYTDTSKFSFVVGGGGALQGLDEGVRYMKEGGKAKMLIPSALAYGTYGAYNGYVNIPGYTPLIFEVILVKVKKVSK